MPPRAIILVMTLALLGFTMACDRKSEGVEGEAAQTTEREERDERRPLPGLAHGLSQSPINILSSRAEGGHHEVSFNFEHAEPTSLVNKGHTIELDFPEGSSITFDGAEYQLKQLHFHTPSEHQIDGVTYPMELHVVYMIEPGTEVDPPRYLVISYLYKMGEEDRFIASFLDRVPSKEGGENLEAGEILIRGEDRRGEYYHYRGSLTTPPYTETVEWLVIKEIQRASPEQIRRINSIEGDNARRVQARHGRSVED
ncbi:MAG: carbonic anhydrase family protein [Polyangiales bacterium]